MKECHSLLHHLSSRRISSSRSNHPLCSKRRRRSFNGAICAVIVVVISPIKQSFGFEPATTKILSEAESKQAIDTIIKGINDNYDKIPAITFKVDTLITARNIPGIAKGQNGNFDVGEGGLNPDGQYKCVYTISKQMIKIINYDADGNENMIRVYDGNTWTTFFPSEMTAQIQHTEQLTADGMFQDPRQIGFDLFRKSEEFLPNILNTWSIEKIEERTDDKEDHLYVVHGTSKLADYMIECSFKYDYLPTKYTIKHKHGIHITYEYQKVADSNAWFPLKVRMRSAGENGESNNDWEQDRRVDGAWKCQFVSGRLTD